MQALDNVSVRFSADTIDGSYDERHGSVIIQDHDSAPKGVKVCEAYQHEGKCSGCRACWDKGVNVIAYPAHGRKMAKVIKIFNHKKEV